MNENQNEAKGKSHCGTVAASIFAVVFIIYFFFPVVFWMPAFVIQRINHHVPLGYKRVVVTGLGPVRYLARRIPLYENALERENDAVRNIFDVEVIFWQ